MNNDGIKLQTAAWVKEGRIHMPTKQRKVRRMVRKPHPNRTFRPKRKASSALMTSMLQLGERDGFLQGWRLGRHLGSCERIAQRTEPDTGTVYDLKLFYVKEGFASLDEGIVEALRGLVREVVPLHESEDAAGLALDSRPDAVIVLNGTRFPVSQTDRLRELGIWTVLWCVDDPYHSDVSAVLAPHYDYVFTHERNAVSMYHELGCKRVHYLPLAAAVHLYHPRRTETSRHTDICLIANAFTNRLSFIDAIAPYLATKKVLIAGWWWDRLSSFQLLRDKIRLNADWMPPEETAACYSSAKIVMNLHRSDHDPFNTNSRGLNAHSINPRTFEICATGAFQLTDVRGDMDAWYRPGIEIETYDSPAQFIEKAEYYLTHDDERETVGLRGFRRTLEEHTYRKRLRTLLDILTAQD
jgi:spore maturation protein CgeB